MHERRPIYTIGHSNKPVEELIVLLEVSEVHVLVDVRSVPYSRHSPQANRDSIERAVTERGILYIFMGDELGGRPDGVDVVDDFGYQDYSMLVQYEPFQRGIGRLLKGAEQHRICLMCSEEDPAKCHRGAAISRVLADAGLDVHHSRHDGRVETQMTLEARVPPVQKSLF